MKHLLNFLDGLSRQFAITTPPLYRYPYRNSAEGLRGDMNRIGKDIKYLLDKEDSHEQ